MYMRTEYIHQVVSIPFCGEWLMLSLSLKHVVIFTFFLCNKILKSYKNLEMTLKSFAYTKYKQIFKKNDDVIKRKYFPPYWPFVRGMHRSANSAHQGQWRGVLMFSLICVWTNGQVNKLRRRCFETLLRSLWRHGNDKIHPWLVVTGTGTIWQSHNIVLKKNNI